MGSTAADGIVVFALTFVLTLAGRQYLVAAQRPTDNPNDEGVLLYHILEELTPGTRIGSVAIDARLAQKYGARQRRQLRYSFLQQPDAERTSRLFAIDDVSGIIRTSQRIDRDTRCPQKPTCFVYLDVAVAPAQFFQVIHVKIEILDVNDNRPTFPQRQINLDISESALTGTGYSLPLAVDQDSGMNGVQKYELVTMSTMFDLTQDITSGEVTDLKLVLTGELDREGQSQYRLQLVAHDGGNPSKSGSAVINITVSDANDHAPVFINSTLEVSVREDRPLNSTIVVLKAVDADLGLNAKVTYYLNGRSAHNYGHIFAINPNSGELYLKRALDFEEETLYNLVVGARDGGAGSPHLAHATVIIHVQDVNDNAPQVTVNTLTDGRGAEISEASPTGTFVAHISVIDRDGRMNGELSCTLDSEFFRLTRMYSNAQQYTIISSVALDREVQASYVLALTCTDHGVPPQATTELIKVRVLDENDHIPYFPKDTYAVTIEENNPVDMFLLKLNATDLDAGANSRIQYRLVDEVLDLFSVDSVTGALKTTISFDHEQIQQIDVKVIAADGGSPPLSATAVVMVQISDVNDEVPTFSQSTYSFGISENRAQHSEVGYVAATDADGEPYDRITYSFDSREAAAGIFQISPSSGRITTMQTLDREGQSVYYLNVMAYNPGYPQTTSSATVTIHVADENDNAPIWDYPDGHNTSVSVSNRVPIGYVVSRVRAHDLDIGTNAQLTFSISGGNRGGLFDIDPTTGAITTKRNMINIDKHPVKVKVKIRAQDGGDEPKVTDGVLTIVINSSIVYRRPNDLRADPPRSAHNMLIVILLSSASAVVLVILVVVLICIKLQTVQRRRQTYKCRPEAQRMLRSIDGKDDDSPMSKIYVPPASAVNVKCKAIGRRSQGEGSSTQNVSGCVAMEEGLQKMASEHYMTNMRYSRPPARIVPECPYTVHHNTKIAGISVPRRPIQNDGFVTDRSAPSAEVTLCGDRRPSKRTYPYQLTLSNEAPPKDLEAHQLLGVLKAERAETESACSGDGSNPDSGRGGSDQGHNEADKVESDSHSEGRYRSSISSNESNQPPHQHQHSLPGHQQQQHQLTNPQRPLAVTSQYPGLNAGRNPDVRPHIYTELKTFSPGGHVRQPNVSQPRLDCVPSARENLNRYKRDAPILSGVSTFGKQRPLHPDGQDGPGQHSKSNVAHDNVDPKAETTFSRQPTLELRPAPSSSPPRGLESGTESGSPGPPDRAPGEAESDAELGSRGLGNGQVAGLNGSPRELAHTDQDNSQDSGVVDPAELCQSIDNAFFQGMVIKHKTLV